MKKLFDLNRVDFQLGVLDTTAAVGAVNGAELDTLHYRSGIVYFNMDTTTETTYVIKVQHKDESSGDWADVDTDLVPLVEGGVTDVEATEKFEVPFKSLKRYVRVVATLAENAADHVIIAYALGDKDYIPSSSEFLSS